MPVPYDGCRMTDGQLDPQTGDGESGLEDQKTRDLIPFLFLGMYARLTGRNLFQEVIRR